MGDVHIYPRGVIILFSEGQYSDFGYCGEVVTLVELHLQDEIDAWRNGLGKDEDGSWIADNWHNGPDVFVAHLVATQKVAPLACNTVHLGSYGEVKL